MSNDGGFGKNGGLFLTFVERKNNLLLLAVIEPRLVDNKLGLSSMIRSAGFILPPVILLALKV